MDGDELRERQTPLKQRYRDEASAALITLHAEGALADNDVTCSVQTGRALVEAGLHPATGGDGSFACSGDMLLQAGWDVSRDPHDWHGDARRERDRSGRRRTGRTQERRPDPLRQPVRNG